VSFVWCFSRPVPSPVLPARFALPFPFCVWYWCSPWKAYKHGFGSKRGEHWLGLDKIHRLSKTMPHTLRINLVAFDGTKGYGTWRTFMVDDEEHKYTLTARKFRDFGVGNSLRYHSGRPFSTYDRDNDAWANNCASYFHGAWWYGACHNANLNGKYYPFPGKHPRNYADGADWLTFKGHFESAKRLKMMFKVQSTLTPPTLTHTDTHRPHRLITPSLTLPSVHPFPVPCAAVCAVTG
jgi:hypothetical protein